jgi:hypothetical protein
MTRGREDRLRRSMTMKTAILAASLLALISTHALAMYHPDEGRWISRDPVEEQGSVALRPRDLPEDARVLPANAYLFARNSPVQSTDYIGLAVQVCCRDVKLGECLWDLLAKVAGKKHCWLKTDTKAVGCGPAEPGKPLTGCPCGEKMALTDHTKDISDPTAKCYTISNCDEAAVNAMLPIGDSQGEWSAHNHCNSFVEGVLKSAKCKNKCLKWSQGNNTFCLEYEVPLGYPVPGLITVFK